jgi:hypothetical protein
MHGNPPHTDRSLAHLLPHRFRVDEHPSRSNHTDKVSSIRWGPTHHRCGRGRTQCCRLGDSGQGMSLAIVDQQADRAVGMINLMTRPQQGVAGIDYRIVPAARCRGIASMR